MAAFEWLQARTGLSAENIGLVGVSYGAATSLQAAPLLPDAAFVMADSAYASLRDIVVYQGARQFGDWTQVLVPGTLLVAGLRGQFDASEVSAEAAVADAAMPIFLTHSLQDEFTPPENTEAIYANSDPDRTVLKLTDWGAPHGRSILEDFDSYETFVDDFLATYVPDFGTSAE